MLSVLFVHISFATAVPYSSSTEPGVTVVSLAPRCSAGLLPFPGPACGPAAEDQKTCQPTAKQGQSCVYVRSISSVNLRRSW
jgi:hypothetical protein